MGVLALFAFAPLASAAGTVGTGTPASCDEAAFDTALAGGGVVDFDCGGAAHTITFTGVKNISASTTIDGGSLISLSGGNSVHHFNVSGANNLTLQNITIEDGNNTGGPGGAINMQTGILTITNSTIQNNTAASTGGAFVSGGGDITVTNSTISGNTTSNSGGVAFINGGTILIDNVVFDQNIGNNGGGVFRIDSGTVDIFDSTFTGNGSSGANGTALQINGGTVTVRRSVFENNTVNDRPVIENTGTLTLERVAMVNNSGIQVSSSSGVTMENVTIGDNTMAAVIGSVYIFGGATANIYNSTIVNSSQNGVTNASSTVNLLNTIVANNGVSDCAGTMTSLDGNLDSDGSCAFGQANDLSSTDPLLNGLSTVSHDDTTGDTRVYQPMVGSPIIDSGVTNVLNPANDQRGVARPVDGDNDTIAVLDRGAFEALMGVDLTAPTLAEVTPIPTPDSNATPSYTFSSTEAGTITYGGACSSATTVASAGNNTITFNTLTPATYTNCTITVTDASLNASTPLAVTAFEVTAASTPTPTTSGGGGGSSGGGCVNISCFTDLPSSEPEPSPEDEACAGYSDILANDPDCAAITYVQSIGAMTGNDDGTFGPDDHLQRDQITKISLEAFGLFDSNEDYCSGSNPFPDVTPSDWSYQYVCRGKQLGIITGYESGEEAGMFMPDNKVILVEFWALILRNLDEVMPLGPSFNGWEADAWYSGYAQYVATNDLYDGSPSPAELVPRRDVAKFLYELHLLGKL